jgi:hypothetical protein
MIGPSMAPCADCGMPCSPNEYHPYAACLMFKACHDGEQVRANLNATRLDGYNKGWDDGIASMRQVEAIVADAAALKESGLTSHPSPSTL